MHILSGDDFIAWLQAGAPDDVEGFKAKLQAEQAETSDLGMVGDFTDEELEPEIHAMLDRIATHPDAGYELPEAPELEDTEAPHLAHVDLVMQTVFGFEHSINGVAGTGWNTMRRMSDKYRYLMPGDRVRMEYICDGVLAGYEVVEVASIAVGSAHSVIGAHGSKNHDAGLRKAYEDHDGEAIYYRWSEIYPDFRNSDEFCAIYFK